MHAFELGYRLRPAPHLFVDLAAFYSDYADLRLDSILRYVDPLPTPGIDRYLELDLRLAWQPRSDLEIALTGRNLLHDHHPEFQPTLVDILATQTQRSGHATLTWSF